MDLGKFSVIEIGHGFMVGIKYDGDESYTMFGERKLEELADNNNIYSQALRALRHVEKAREINNGTTTKNNT